MRIFYCKNCSTKTKTNKLNIDNIFCNCGTVLVRNGFLVKENAFLFLGKKRKQPKTNYVPYQLLFDDPALYCQQKYAKQKEEE